MDQPLKFGFIPIEGGEYYPEFLEEVLLGKPRGFESVWQEEHYGMRGHPLGRGRTGLAVSVARQIEIENEEVELIQSGNIFKAGATITDPMRAVVMSHCPKDKLIRLDGPPVVGAVILSMEQVSFDGYPLRDLMIKTAKEILN